MWKRMSLAAVLLASSAPALASNWIYAGKNSTGSTYEIDAESVKRDGDTVIFWQRVRYGPTVTAGESDGYTALRRANCADRSYNDIQTNYTKGDALVRTTGEEEKRFASPDSIAASVISKVCGR